MHPAWDMDISHTPPYTRTMFCSTSVCILSCRYYRCVFFICTYSSWCFPQYVTVCTLTRTLTPYNRTVAHSIRIMFSSLGQQVISLIYLKPLISSILPLSLPPLFPSSFLPSFLHFVNQKSMEQLLFSRFYAKDTQMFVCLFVPRRQKCELCFKKE